MNNKAIFIIMLMFSLLFTLCVAGYTAEADGTDDRCDSYHHDDYDYRNDDYRDHDYRDRDYIDDDVATPFELLIVIAIIIFGGLITTMIAVIAS